MPPRSESLVAGACLFDPLQPSRPACRPKGGAALVDRRTRRLRKAGENASADKHDRRHKRHRFSSRSFDPTHKALMPHPAGVMHPGASRSVKLPLAAPGRERQRDNPR